MLLVRRLAALGKRNVRVIVTGEINLDAHCFKLLFNFQRQLEVVVFFVTVAVSCADIVLSVAGIKANIRVSGVGVLRPENSAVYANGNDDRRQNYGGNDNISLLFLDFELHFITLIMIG